MTGYCPTEFYLDKLDIEIMMMIQSSVHTISIFVVRLRLDSLDIFLRVYVHATPLKLNASSTARAFHSTTAMSKGPIVSVQVHCRRCHPLSRPLKTPSNLVT